ncbi:MAG: hypothetical protein GSR84_00645 [Desulfurococcales archaeon]|nr:hypothetical protein [Desulfurococcales archaeon]
MRKSIIVILLLVVSMTRMPISVGEAKPLVLGEVYEGGYVVLYSDSTIKVGGESYELRGLGVDLETVFTITYSKATGDLFMAGFYNTSPTSGVSYIILYNTKTQSIDYQEKYQYSITRQGEIKGRFMTEAVYIPSRGIIAAMYSNTTSTYIQVSSINGETRIYEAPASLNFYTDGATVYAALIEETQFEGRTARLVAGVDLVTGERVAEYPSLIPVVDLAIPLVQLYKEAGQWIGYVVVYNPTSGQLEYYRVEPGSLSLPETDPVVVSPDLSYAVKLGREGPSLILPDGEEVSLGYDARPAPPTIYLGAEPGNAILDIDSNGILLRVTKGGDTAIIYKTLDGGEEEVYSIPGRHNRLTGLYAIEDNGKIVILDPVKGEVIELNRPNPTQASTKQQNTQPSTEDNTAATPKIGSRDNTTGPLLLVIAGIALAGFVAWRRMKRGETNR